MIYQGPNGVVVRIEGCEEGDVLYTNQYIGSVNITRIKKMLEGREPVEIGMEVSNVYGMLRQQDIDNKRVMELLNGPKEALEVPVIHMIMPDSTHLLLDGNHRVAARYVQHGANNPEPIIIRSHILNMGEVKPHRVRYFITKPPALERLMTPMEIIAPTWGIYTDAEGRRRK